MGNGPAALSRWMRPVHHRDAALIGLGLFASILAHLLLGLWASGLLLPGPKLSRDDAISVQLVPAEEAPPPPRSSDAAAASEPGNPASPNAPAEAPAPGGEQEPGQSSVVKASPGKATDLDPMELSEAERAEVIAQAKFCWNIPAGWTDPLQVSVTVRFLLNPDGTLKGQPVVVEFPASGLGKAAADNAVLAVIACAPFGLPAEKYEQWKDMQLRFTP